MLGQIRKITSNNKTFVFGLFLTAVLVGTSGCGANGSPVSTLVNNVKLRTYAQNNEQWMEISVLLSTGGFSLAGINLPIVNPKDNTKIYGELSMIPTLCSTSPCYGGGELAISVNLTQTTQVQGIDIALPNGTRLPVGGLQNATVVALPIAQTGAKIYIAFGQGVAMFGAAVPFSAMDPAGKYVPGVNIFEPLTFNKINLIAGIFAGAAPNTTGVGLFVDLSSTLNQNIPAERLFASAHDAVPDTRDGMILPWRNGVHSVVTMGPVKPSLATERRLYQKLYRLSQQGLTLKVE
ncbi:MAG: hypothetical protein ABIQ95_10370 [Bdellovibrionia bacterium]